MTAETDHVVRIESVVRLGVKTGSVAVRHVTRIRSGAPRAARIGSVAPDLAVKRKNRPKMKRKLRKSPSPNPHQPRDLAFSFPTAKKPYLLHLAKGAPPLPPPQNVGEDPLPTRRAGRRKTRPKLAVDLPGKRLRHQQLPPGSDLDTTPTTTPPPLTRKPSPLPKPSPRRIRGDPIRPSAGYRKRWSP